MRFDQRIIFYSSSDRKYNPKTHQYEGGSSIVAKIYGNVTDVGTNRSVQVLGNLNAKAKTIRLVSEPPLAWSYLMIEGSDTHYRLTTDRKPLKGYTLIVGEDNGKA